MWRVLVRHEYFLRDIRRDTRCWFRWKPGREELGASSRGYRCCPSLTRRNRRHACGLGQTVDFLDGVVWCLLGNCSGQTVVRFGAVERAGSHRARWRYGFSGPVGAVYSWRVETKTDWLLRKKIAAGDGCDGAVFWRRRELNTIWDVSAPCLANGAGDELTSSGTVLFSDNGHY